MATMFVLRVPTAFAGDVENAFDRQGLVYQVGQSDRRETFYVFADTAVRDQAMQIAREVVVSAVDVPDDDVGLDR